MNVRQRKGASHAKSIFQRKTQKLVATQLQYTKKGICVRISTVLGKEENQFLQLNLEESFAVPKKSAS